MQDLLPIVGNLAPTELKSAVGETLADVWQSLIGDRVSAFRLRNAAKLSSKVSEQLAKDGTAPRWDRVPERYAIAWFETATNEDNATIQDLFATLLRKAAEGDANALDRRNVEIVGSFSPADAAFVEMLHNEFTTEIEKKKGQSVFLCDFSTLEKMASKPGEVYSTICIDNAVAAGILQHERNVVLDDRKLERWLKGQTGRDGGSFWTIYPIDDAIITNDEVILTQRGAALINALFA